MHRLRTMTCIVALTLGCQDAGVASGVHNGIHLLANGDSVEVQSTGPLVVSGEATGLLVTYHPFQPLDDTVRLRRTALALFSELRTTIDNAAPPFVLLNAVDRPAADRPPAAAYQMRRFGVVVERRSDGRWYELGTEIPLDVAQTAP